MLDRLAESPSKSLFFWTCAFIAAVAVHALDERVWGRGALLLVFACGFAVIAVLIRRAHTPQLFCVAAALFFLGLWRYDGALLSVPIIEALPTGQQRYKGTLADEPRTRLHDTIYETDRVFIYDAGKWLLLGASMQVRAGPGAARYGDVVEWRCAAQTADRSQFLLSGTGWRCSSRKAPVVTGSSPTNALKRFLLAARSHLRRLAGRLFPEPESSFLLGLLIGDIDGIPQDLRDAFRRTGTSHILAVSGYNVARVIEMVVLLSTLALAKRKRAAMATAVAVLGFVLLAGASASVVRAGVMGGVSLLARLLGRRYSGTNALVCAAAVMLAVLPFALRHDVGFQLSFAAVWGLHALGPSFIKWARFIPERFGLRSIFGETLAATLATLPISLAVFGTLSILSPIVNLVVLPLIPAAMGSGALALGTGAIHPLAAAPAALIAQTILATVETVVRLFARLPLAFFIPVTPWVATLLYGWIVILWYALTKAKPLPLARKHALRDEFIIEVIDYGA